MTRTFGTRLAAGFVMTLLTMVAVAWSVTAPAAADETAFTIDDFQGSAMGPRSVVFGAVDSCDRSDSTTAVENAGTLKVNVTVPDSRGCNYASAELRWTAPGTVDIRQGGADRIELRYRDVVPNIPGAVSFGLRVVDINGNVAHVGGLSRNGGPAGDWLTIRYAPAYLGDVAVLSGMDEIDSSQVKSISLLMAANTNNQNISVTFEGVGGNTGEPTYQAPVIGANTTYAFLPNESSSVSFDVTGNPAPDVSITSLPAWMSASSTQDGSVTTVTLSGDPGEDYGQSTVKVNAVVANSLTDQRDVSIVVPSPVQVDYAEDASTAVDATESIVLGTVSAFPAPSLRNTPTGLPPGTHLELRSPDSGEDDGVREVVLAGTPTAGGKFTVAASLGHDWAQAAFTCEVIVTQAPTISESYGRVAVLGDAITPVYFDMTGYPAPTLSSSPLPDGLTLDPRGAITGTPTSIGVTTVTATATNEVGSASTSFTVYVGLPPVAEGPDSAEFFHGVQDQIPFVTSPDAAAISVTGVPPGMALTYVDSQFSLRGAPQLDDGVDHLAGTLELAFTNLYGNTPVSVPWTVTRPVVPVIEVPDSTTVTLGEEVDIPVTVTSVPDATVSIAGAPAGVAWEPSATGGRLVGSADALGTWTIEVTADSGVGQPVSTTVTLEVVLPVIDLSIDATSVTQGDTVEVTASGFQPAEVVEVWLHSDPVLLASGTAGADGTFALSVTVPPTAAVGEHQLVVLGATGATASTAVTVTAVVPDDTGEPDDTAGGDGTDSTEGTDGTGNADDAGGASPDSGSDTSTTGNDGGLAATGTEPGALIALSLLALAGGALLVRRVRY